MKNPRVKRVKSLIEKTLGAKNRLDADNVKQEVYELRFTDRLLYETWFLVARLSRKKKTKKERKRGIMNYLYRYLRPLWLLLAKLDKRVGSRGEKSAENLPVVKEDLLGNVVKEEKTKQKKAKKKTEPKVSNTFFGSTRMKVSQFKQYIEGRMNKLPRFYLPLMVSLLLITILGTRAIITGNLIQGLFGDRPTESRPKVEKKKESRDLKEKRKKKKPSTDSKKSEEDSKDAPEVGEETEGDKIETPKEIPPSDSIQTPQIPKESAPVLGANSRTNVPQGINQQTPSPIPVTPSVPIEQPPFDSSGEGYAGTIE